MTDDDNRETDIATLKAAIYERLADFVAGRVKDFDPASIAERGRMLLAARDELATIEGIKAGMRDARAGRTVSHEEAMAEIQAVIDAARRRKA